LERRLLIDWTAIVSHAPYRNHRLDPKGIELREHLALRCVHPDEIRIQVGRGRECPTLREVGSSCAAQGDCPARRPLGAQVCRDRCIVEG
jgi:hypothetical protein